MPDFSKLIPEQPPEQFPENGSEGREKLEVSLGEKRDFETTVATEQASVQPPPAAPYVLTKVSATQKKVEKILEEGLEQLYNELNPQDQVKFRRLGEVTAEKITVLLNQAKIKISEILNLIRQWLMSVTGINRYFVEQEAKIKAEKILKIKQEK